MHFSHQSDSDATILFAAATIQHEVSPVIEIDGSLGLERANFSNTLPGQSQDKILFSGDAQICRRGEFTQLCARSAMSTEPSGLGTVQRRFSGGITYAHRLAEFSNLSFGVDYQRTTGLSSESEEPLQYLQATAGFDKKITNSLTLDTFLKYRRRGGSQSGRGSAGGI